MKPVWIIAYKLNRFYFCVLVALFCSTKELLPGFVGLFYNCPFNSKNNSKRVLTINSLPNGRGKLSGNVRKLVVQDLEGWMQESSRQNLAVISLGDKTAVKFLGNTSWIQTDLVTGEHRSVFHRFHRNYKHKESCSWASLTKSWKTLTTSRRRCIPLACSNSKLNQSDLEHSLFSCKWVCFLKIGCVLNISSS